MPVGPIHQALILAGGLGTRFRAISADSPKSLAQVGGEPVAERQIRTLREGGVGRVILCVGHMADAIEAHFGDGRRLGVEIVYAREKELLGTAGAMRNARSLLRPGAFFAMNGDAYVEGLDFAALGRLHERRFADAPATAGTLVVIRPPDAGAYGVLELDAAGERLVRFKEKAPIDPSDTTTVVNAGIYVLEPRFFEHIPAGRKVSIEYESFPECIKSGEALWVFRHTGFFGDIGTPEGYNRVLRRLEAGVAGGSGAGA